MQRRSSKELLRIIQPSFSRRCNNVTNDGCSIAQTLRYFGLCKGISCQREMQQRPPLCLAQTHWLQSFVQLQSPGTSSPVKQRPKCFVIGHVRQIKLVSMLTNSNLPACQRSFRANFEQKQLAFAIIPHTSTQMRTSRRPSWCSCRFGFFVTLNKKIMRISRQLLDVTHVFQRRFHIKKYRLIFWVHRIKRLIRGNESINFGGGLLHLLPVSQDDRRDWITNRSNYDSNSNEKRNYFGPCSLVRRPFFPGPLQCMSGVAHRQQP